MAACRALQLQYQEYSSVKGDFDFAKAFKGSAICRTGLPMSLCFLAQHMPGTVGNNPHAGHVSAGSLQGTAMCRQTSRRPPSSARGTSWWPAAATMAACASIVATQGSLSRCWRPTRMWPTVCRWGDCHVESFGQLRCWSGGKACPQLQHTCSHIMHIQGRLGAFAGMFACN